MHGCCKKNIKILQSGYAPPGLTGSKLLKKLTPSSCEEINRKVLALLDLVKQMEGTYKLVDPMLITQDNDYQMFGLIGIVVCVKKEHTQLATDHEWLALAIKLSERNLAKKNLAKPTYASKLKEGVDANVTDVGQRITFIRIVLNLWRHVLTCKYLDADLIRADSWIKLRKVMDKWGMSQDMLISIENGIRHYKMNPKKRDPDNTPT
jgi:hypothetical protein